MNIKAAAIVLAGALGAVAQAEPVTSDNGGHQDALATAWVNPIAQPDDTIVFNPNEETELSGSAVSHELEPADILQDGKDSLFGSTRATDLAAGSYYFDRTTGSIVRGSGDSSYVTSSHLISGMGTGAYGSAYFLVAALNADDEPVVPAPAAESIGTAAMNLLELSGFTLAMAGLAAIGYLICALSGPRWLSPAGARHAIRRLAAGWVARVQQAVANNAALHGQCEPRPVARRHRLQ